MRDDLRRETDDEAGTYLAAPAEGAGLGVLVIAGAQTVDAEARSFCDRLAEEGFTGLAVARTADLAEAVADLEAHEAVRGNGVAVVGLGEAASTALGLAALRPETVRAVVPFDAPPPPDGAGDGPALAGVRAAVEGHYAEGAVSQAGSEPVRRLEEALEGHGCDVRMFTYPLVSPGFTDDGRGDVYDEDSARQAWVRTLEFLRAKLG